MVEYVSVAILSEVSLGDFSGGELVIETDDPQLFTIRQEYTYVRECTGRSEYFLLFFRNFSPFFVVFSQFLTCKTLPKRVSNDSESKKKKSAVFSNKFFAKFFGFS